MAKMAHKKAEKAKEELAKLPKEMQTKIQKRFVEPETLINDIAERMDKEVPFPEALLAAVKEEDPALAAELEKRFSAVKVEAPPEEKAEEVEVGAEVTAAVGGGIVGTTPVGTAAVATEISVGENVTIEGDATVMKDLNSTEGINYGWTVSTCIGDACMSVYRDPTVDAEIAGTGSYYIEVSEKAGVGIEPEVEVGKDMEGGKYIAVSSSVYFESEEHDLSTYVSPMITIPIEEAPTPAFGFEASIVKGLSKGFFVGGKAYLYDVTEPEVTATIVIGKKF